MSEAESLYQKLLPALAGLSPTRARVEAVYNNWLLDSALPDGPANFIHAVVSSHEACANQTPKPDRARNADAMRLALSALGTAELAHPCFCAMVGAGLFDHQIKAVDGWLKTLKDVYACLGSACRWRTADHGRRPAAGGAG